jgi:hypothetical protein
MTGANKMVYNVRGGRVAARGAEPFLANEAFDHAGWVMDAAISSFVLAPSKICDTYDPIVRASMWWKFNLFLLLFWLLAIRASDCHASERLGIVIVNVALVVVIAASARTA